MKNNTGKNYSQGKEKSVQLEGKDLTGMISDANYPAGVRCYSTNILKGDLIWQINNTPKN